MRSAELVDNEDATVRRNAELELDAYRSSDWLQNEQRRLFHTVWNFVAMEHEIIEPGSYVTAEVAKAAIILIRDEQGELRAFHNVCRHRGVRIAEGSGMCKAFVCPYHHWRYSLDDSLRTVPQSRLFAQLDVNKLGLRTVAVASFWGMLFVNLDASPEPLSAFLAGFEAEAFERVDSTQMKLLARLEWDVDANWKFIVENNLDCLHVSYLHGKTLASIDGSDFENKYCGPHYLSIYPIHEKARAADMHGIQGISFPYPAFTSNFIFPNSLLMFSPTGAIYVRVVPLKPEKSRVVLYMLGEADFDVQTELAATKRIMEEDLAIATSMQSNVRSPAFGGGPIAARLEDPVVAFQKSYLSYLSPASDAL